MRKILLLFVVSLLTGVAWGQSYTYYCWIDNDPTIVKTGTATGEKQFNVNIASLSAGLHLLHVQAFQNNKGRSSVRTLFFIKQEQTTATTARYWIDNDLNTMHNGVATSGVIDLDIASLKAGLHVVHYQTFNAKGEASAVRSRCFLIIEQSTATTARYWYDNDANSLHEGVATNGIIDLDISKLDVGLHVVHYQTLNAKGDASAVRTKHFFVDQVQMGSLTASIVIDDGEAANYALSEDDIEIDISELEEGTHTLAVKLLDTKGHLMAEQTDEFEYGPFVVTGDANGDGTINGTDLVALVSMILGQQEENSAADVNGDGVVNGTDYVALVDMILNAENTQSGVNAARQMNDTRPVVAAEPIAVSAENGCALNVSLSNPDMDVTLLQLDMTLPQGLRLKSTDDDYDIAMTGRTTWKSHSLYVREKNDNTFRLLLASGKNVLIAGHEGAVMKLNFEADSSFEGGDIVFDNILCTSPSQQESRPLPLCVHLSKGNLTAIREITSEETGAAVYSLSGQRLSKTQRGINIIGGKKKIVK